MLFKSFIFESADSLSKIKGVASMKSMPLEQRANVIFNIAKQSFGYIGMGSNRTAFDIGNSKIIKISYSESATYDIGSSVEQTRSESKVCKIAQKAQLIPEIYEVGDDYLFVIAEKVENLDDGSKEKISSYFKFDTYEKFENALKIVSNNAKATSKHEIEEVTAHRDFLIAVTVMKDCGYAISDMVNPHNWGLDPQGRPVMLDTGLTTDNKAEIIAKQQEKIKNLSKAQQPSQQTQQAPKTNSSFGDGDKTKNVRPVQKQNNNSEEKTVKAFAR